MPAHLFKEPAMSKTRRVSVAVLAALYSVSALANTDDPAPEPSSTPVQAIWKAQELTFYYQSFTTFYSCSSLETKVKRVLVAVGASKDMKIRTRGCTMRHEIAKMPYVEITLLSPVEATPEELAELDKTRSHRELVARVRGDSKQAELAETQFPAHWKRVSLSRGKLNLEPGDCELIEQLQKKVFPKLAVRTVDDQVECAPNQISLTQPRLVVDVLSAMPTPDEGVKSAPEEKDKS
jgi:hypothetical protein